MVVPSLKLLAFYASYNVTDFVEINYTYEKAIHVLSRFFKHVRSVSKNLVFTCPLCRGNNRRHSDWCPWLPHAIQRNPKKASWMKFMCQYCNGGIRRHRSNCWWVSKYGTIDPNVIIEYYKRESQLRT